MTDTILDQPVLDDIDENDGFIDTFTFGGDSQFDVAGKPGSRYYQFITFKKMSEGDRIRYERLTNQPFAVNRKTDEALIKMDQGLQRQALIKCAVTGWSLYQRDKSSGAIVPVPFTLQALDQWLQVTDPGLIDRLAESIRKQNPWLIATDATEEDIVKEIESLQEQLVVVRSREQGNA